MEIRTNTRPTEATSTTKSYAVNDFTETRLAAADAAGNDYSRATDDGQDDYSPVVGTAGDDYHRSKEDRLTTSHLLGRFTELYREGRLEEAAATLQQALGLMESKRRMTARSTATRLQDTTLPGGSSIVHEEGKAPYWGAKGSTGAHPEAEVVAGDELLESAAEASAIAGVMNDLGCTLLEVKGTRGA